MTFQELSAKLQALKDVAVVRGEPMFMGIPDSWFDKPGPLWRCPNDHVSSWYIQSEEKGDLCPDCYGNVRVTFPEDKAGPLS